MAARCDLSAPSCLVRPSLCGDKLGKKLTPCLPSSRAVRLRVNAAKLPPGVEVPRVQPKLSEPFLGFTQTAEIWNSRACMIGAKQGDSSDNWCGGGQGPRPSSLTAIAKLIAGFTLCIL